jgi:glycosyltransferase involved in cell wall biosynthesis
MFAHAPNLDAAHFLADEVMPLARQIEPGITCLLVGDGLARDAICAPGIEITGHVADLQQIFDRVRLTVAPLRFGAGLKGKVLESYAAGLPCVMTPVAAEGFCRAGTAADLVGADAAGLAAPICRIDRSPPMHDAAVEAGLSVIGGHYTGPIIRNGLRQAIAGGGQLYGRNPIDTHGTAATMISAITSVAM